MLVWSAQNWSISSEICHDNNHKIGPFLPIAFWWGLPLKLPRNSREIGRFFREFVSKNAAKLDFFFPDLSEALVFVRSFTPNTTATTSWDSWNFRPITHKGKVLWQLKILKTYNMYKDLYGKTLHCDWGATVVPMSPYRQILLTFTDCRSHYILLKHTAEALQGT